MIYIISSVINSLNCIPIHYSVTINKKLVYFMLYIIHNSERGCQFEFMFYNSISDFHNGTILISKNLFIANKNNKQEKQATRPSPKVQTFVLLVLYQIFDADLHGDEFSWVIMAHQVHVLFKSLIFWHLKIILSQVHINQTTRAVKFQH